MSVVGAATPSNSLLMTLLSLVESDGSPKFSRLKSIERFVLVDDLLNNYIMKVCTLFEIYQKSCVFGRN